jgi:hypothetical protein
MPFNYERSKARLSRLQNELNTLAEQDGMTPENPVYAEKVAAFDTLDRLTREYEQSTRETDENGKLLKAPETRLPATFTPEEQKVPKKPSDYLYFYEPSVKEASEALKRDPELVNTLRLNRWNGTVVPGVAEDVADPMSGAVGGQNTTPDRGWLDALTERSTPYQRYADHAWDLAQQEAAKHGKSIQRYRDVPYEEGSKADYIVGGIGKHLTRTLPAAAMGVANAATAGTAGPIMDSTNERIDEFNQDLGLRRDFEPSTSQDIANRSPGANLVGELVGSGVGGRFNLTNLAQEGVQAALKYGERNAVGKALASAAAGAAASTGEGIIRDAVRPGEGHQKIRDALGNIPFNAGLGAAAGGAFDLIGQGAGAAKDAIRNGTPDIDTLRTEGGDTRLIRGAKPPKAVDELNAQRRAAFNRGEEFIGQPDRIIANRVAPDIERSLESQTAAENERIGKQVSDYFEHPAYRNIRKNALPAVRGLVGLASKGWTRDRVSGGLVNVDPDLFQRISEVLRRVAPTPKPAPRGQANELAHTFGGMVIDSRLANELYHPEVPFPDNHDVILAPVELDAESLTHLERSIDDALKRSSARGSTEDPAWETLNQGIKDMRDEFPLYRDENGELVPPPVEHSRYPFRPEAGGEPLAGDVEVLQRPRDIEGDIPVDADTAGLHPGAGPFLPPNPFDPSPLMPIARETLHGDKELNVRGGEYAEPPMIPPEAIPGPGPNRGHLQGSLRPKVQGERPVVLSETAEPENLPYDFLGVGPKRDRSQFDPDINRTEQVEGGYWPRPVGEEPHMTPVEPPPQTPRQPHNVKTGWGELAKRPGDQPVHQPIYEGEFADSSPNPGFPDDATPLSLLAGNDLVLRRQPIDEPPELFHDGHTEPMLREPTERMLPPERPDERGPLERSLDAQLGDPNQSLPTPTGKEWEEEGIEKWYEGMMEPGRTPRSEEVQRVMDLTAQKSAFDEAEAMVRNIEERLGPMDDKSRIQSLLNIVSQKLGREVTKEDLVRAGILSAGAAAVLGSDDDNTFAKQVGGSLMLGATMGRGGRRTGPPGGPTSINEDIAALAPKPPPKQPEFTLPNTKGPDGEPKVVRGFGALRHEQHEALSGLEKAKARVGAGGETTLEKRVLNYNQNKNSLEQDRALAAEAEKIGKTKELQEAAAAGAYNRLKGVGLSWERLKQATVIRADRVLDLLSGAKANTFADDPKGFESWLREQLNITGGRTGARYTNDIEAIHEALFGKKKEKKTNAR